MSIKQIVAKLSLLAALTCLLVIVVGASSARADVDSDGWCKSDSRVGSDAAGSDDCIAKTWEALSPKAQEFFQGDINNLRTTVMNQCFSLAELTRVYHLGGECANAVRYCTDHIIDINRCKDKSLLQDQSMCNIGKGTGNGGCPVIAKANEELIGAEDTKTRDAILKGCTPRSDKNESQGDANIRCGGEYDTVKKYCYGQQSDSSGNHKIDIAAYTKCMQERSRHYASSQKECEGAYGGGQWDPNGHTDWSDFEGKCNAPPSTPPKDPCEGHGGVDPNDKTKCKDGTGPNDAEPANGSPLVQDYGYCGKAKVNILRCSTKGENIKSDQVFTRVLQIILRVLTLLVGAAVLSGLAWASVTYARAGDNASVVSSAKDMVRNTLIALLLYGFLLGIINWLVPNSVIEGVGGQSNGSPLTTGGSTGSSVGTGNGSGTTTPADTPKKDTPSGEELPSGKYTCSKNPETIINGMKNLDVRAAQIYISENRYCPNYPKGPALPVCTVLESCTDDNGA